MDSMPEATTDESDGQDDAEFLSEHQKYLEFCEKHTEEVLKQEQERQNVSPWFYKKKLMSCSMFEIRSTKLLPVDWKVE
jgi:hypothetical protein